MVGPRPKVVQLSADDYATWALGSDGSVHQHDGRQWRRIPGPFDGDAP
jgi:hypothetical protein